MYSTFLGIPDADKPQIVLASGSPRRLELLVNCLGCDRDAIKVIVPEVEEGLAKDKYIATLLQTSPEKYVEEIAMRKGLAVAQQGVLSTSDMSKAMIVSADTIILTNEGMVLEKPKTEKEAAEMLEKLSETTHDVLTSFCVIQKEGIELSASVKTSKTRVTFSTLPQVDITAYVKSGEPFNKAGGYAYQGAGSQFVEAIEGCAHNVIGLPVMKVSRAIAKLVLERAGHSLPQQIGFRFDRVEMVPIEAALDL